MIYALDYYLESLGKKHQTEVYYILNGYVY